MSESFIFASLPESLLHVGGFLDMMDLAFLEQACSLHIHICGRLWEGAALRVLSQTALWSPHAHSAVDKLQEQRTSWKQFVQELKLLRRTIFSPEAWRPWIGQESFCSLKVAPRLQDPTEDVHSAAVREDDDVDHWNMMSAQPCQAVAVSIGASLGQSLVVGIKIVPEGPLNDDICLGIEACGSVKTMSVTMAPFSGHCFIQHAGRGPTMKTAALQSLDVVPESLRVWIQVTGSGAVRFLRHVQGSEPEDAGLWQPESFPKWVREYFACLHVWGYTLKGAATVSIDHAGDSFPSWFVDAPATEMDTVWELLNEDNW